jgi:hypothetical protein
MSEGSFTEVTTTSWWSRIKSALVGIILGLLLIPGSSVLMFWNEGRAVQTARSLAEGAGLVTAAPVDRVDSGLEGRLIHLAAAMRVAAPLADAEFGVTAPGALRLVRTVEMYQWREETRSETRDRLGGGQETVTTYSYSLAWATQPIDSSRFRQPQGRSNPPMRYRGLEVVARDARLGPFTLREQQLAGFGSAAPLRLEAATLRLPAGGQVLDGAIFLGADPANPRPGDMRISFGAVPAEPASVLARQAGQGLAPYQTRAGDALFLLRPGTASAAEMIAAAEAANQLLTWALRLVGAVLMFVGFTMVLRPLVVLAAVVPLFGSVMAAGTGLVSGVLTLLLAPVVVAVAWFWYRPLTAAVVLALGFAAAAGLGWMIRLWRAAAPMGTPARG